MVITRIFIIFSGIILQDGRKSKQFFFYFGTELFPELQAMKVDKTSILRIGTVARRAPSCYAIYAEYTMAYNRYNAKSINDMFWTIKNDVKKKKN
jgi:hypothetical protein